MNGPKVLACPACGGPTQFGAAFCVYCRGPLTWGTVPVLARGRLVTRIDGTKDALDKRELQAIERTNDGTVVTVGPRLAGNGSVGPRRRHGCIVVEAAAIDSNATIGVCARQTESGASGGYSLAVVPHFQSVDLAKVVASKTHVYSRGLYEWEFHANVRRVGRMNEVELRLADSIIQIFVNGENIATCIDATFGFGTFGWRIQSLTGAPARALVRSASVYDVA